MKKVSIFLILLLFVLTGNAQVDFIKDDKVVSDGDTIKLYPSSIELAPGFTIVDGTIKEPYIKNTTSNSVKLTVKVSCNSASHFSWCGITTTCSPLNNTDETRETTINAGEQLALDLHPEFTDGVYDTYLAEVTATISGTSKRIFIKYIYGEEDESGEVTEQIKKIEVDGIYYNILESYSKTVEVTFNGNSYDSFDEYKGDIKIPSEVNYNGVTYTVVGLGKNCFSSCTNLKSLELPSTLKTVDNTAFYKCNNLSALVLNCSSIGNWFSNVQTMISSVELGVSVKYIEERAFNGFNKISSIEIPNSVLSIGKYAFSGCTNLHEVKISNSVTSIASSAFYACNNISKLHLNCTKIENWFSDLKKSVTDIYLGESVKAIGDYAFSDFCKISNIELPNTVNSIGKYAFSGCTCLKELEIPNSIVNISETSFAGCNNITKLHLNCNNIGNWFSDMKLSVQEVFLDDLVENIGTSAFKGFEVLNKLRISSNILSISDYAFEGCKNLTILELPESLQTIGEYSFSNCAGLSSINIPASVSHIGNKAFFGCNNVTKLKVYCKNIKDWFSGINSSVNEIIIGETVDTISAYAFNGFSRITEISIPQSVKFINESIFANCENLSIINVDSNNIYYDSRENCNAIINTKENIIVAGCKNTKFPTSINSIGNGAFEGCTGLKELELPEQITSIGNKAFYECSTLANVYIPSSTKIIAENAFEHCDNLKVLMINTDCVDTWFSRNTSLKKVILGDNVKRISKNAFFGCSYVNSVIPSENINYVGENAFYGTQWLNEQPNGVIYLGKSLYKYKGTMPNNTTLVINNGTHSITDLAFSDCSNLERIEFPSTLKSIGRMAFKNCTKLSEFIVPQFATELGDSILYNCKKIRVLKVLCDTLPANKFDNLSSLQKVVLGGDLKHIENGVFTGCESLDSLVCYSEHIKNWGIYVDNLTDFTIGNSVKTIGEDVFKAMYSLENITIESSVPPIVDENAFAKFQFSSVKLSVPEESIEVYKSEEVWGKFYTINGWVPANISILKSNDNKPIVVYTNNGINIVNANKQHISIYSIDGKLIKMIKEYNGNTLYLQPNLYVLKVGDYIVKVIIK